MIQLYDHDLSGNCHKVRLMLSLLGLEHELVSVDLMKSEHKSPQFMKLNPLGQVPVLVDNDVVIRDAQAILVYLTRRYGSDWLPTEAELMSKIMQWLSIAANEMQHSLAAARKFFLLSAQIDLELAQNRAHEILQIIDQHLAQRKWLESNRPTVADVACFPYIGLAADGKISLEAYPHVIAWKNRIQQLPGYIGMPGL